MNQNRKCVVVFTEKSGGPTKCEHGIFRQFGSRVVTDEGNNKMQETIAIVEMNDGRLIEVKPTDVTFLNGD